MLGVVHVNGKEEGPEIRGQVPEKNPVLHATPTTNDATATSHLSHFYPPPLLILPQPQASET